MGYLELYHPSLDVEIDVIGDEVYIYRFDNILSINDITHYYGEDAVKAYQKAPLRVYRGDSSQGARVCNKILVFEGRGQVSATRVYNIPNRFKKEVFTQLIEDLKMGTENLKAITVPFKPVKLSEEELEILHRALWNELYETGLNSKANTKVFYNFKLWAKTHQLDISQASLILTNKCFACASTGSCSTCRCDFGIPNKDPYPSHCLFPGSYYYLWSDRTGEEEERTSIKSKEKRKYYAYLLATTTWGGHKWIGPLPTWETFLEVFSKRDSLLKPNSYLEYLCQNTSL